MKSSKPLIAVYALIALLAFVGTWGHNLAYLNLGWLGANLQFWNDTLVSEASTSITIDIFFFGLAVNIWMVLEARRLSMRWVWAYIVGGILVAISVAFPLFMIHRERVLGAPPPVRIARVTTGDVIGLVLLGLGAVAFCARTFIR